VGATFNTIVSANVGEAIAHDPVSIDKDHQIPAKGGTRELERSIKSVNEIRPIAMTVTFGGGRYTREALSEYLEALARLKNFKLVVFLDRNERFLACMSPWAAKQRLNVPGLAEEFVRVINEGSKDLFYFPGVVRKTISIRSTNAEALREMVAHNLDAIAVTDETNRLRGIAEREQVLGRMVLALTQ
jgi:hypothetical protein